MLRNKIRAERKIQLEGGNGVGPARVPKSAEQRRKGGRNRDNLIDDLVIEGKVPKAPHSCELKLVVYCIACDRMVVGRDATRIRSHAKECDVCFVLLATVYLTRVLKIKISLQELAEHFPVLYRRLTKELVDRAHSTKLEKLSSGSELGADSQSTMVTDLETIEEAMDEPKAQRVGILAYMNPAKMSDKQMLKVELLMFQMFICCALPWALMDNEFFANFVLALAPTFILPDRSSFFPKLLAQEIAVWGKNFEAFLKGKAHLTLSLDGWSTRAKEEVYTFHTTTPKRRSFFTDGHVFRGVSVTGDALLSVAIKVSV